MTILPSKFAEMDAHQRARPCVIVGSGFSREISDAMPIMNDLGRDVLQDLGLPDSALDPFGGNLEQWMSYLAVDQPWLSPADNFENRALFERVSRAVYEIIKDAESRTLTSKALPVWLERLAWTWCDQEARIFSFNYDTLLERAVGAVNRVTSLGDLYVAAVADRTAAGDGGFLGAGPPLGKLLSLYKLHGSVSWAFGGLDGPPNDRIVLTERQLRWLVNSETDQPQPSPRELQKFDDLVPLIVPPTLTKGPFFSNLTLRAQWRRAADVLRSADRLTVIGYSFPPADLVAQQWVGTNFQGDRMDVIDRSETRPALIRETLANARQGDDKTGAQAIQAYVDRECGDHVAWRIWSDGDDLGAKASLSVNGSDLLAAVDPRYPPWGGNDYLDAQTWIHQLVDSAGGEWSVDRAQGPMSGSWEERRVVLPPGKRLVIRQ